MLIGVIDSGVGGLEYINKLDNNLDNKYILLKDNAFFPYGNKSKEFLLKRTIFLIDYLIELNVEKIILACNTLSIYVLVFVKELYDIEIVGVFDNLIKYFKKGNIFIGTTNSVKYVRNNYDVDAVSVDALINMIENNIDYTSLIDKYNKYIFQYYNNVIFGCTHLLKIPYDIIDSKVIDQFI